MSNHTQRVHINQVNMEIDYKKLAEEIVRAEEQSKVGSELENAKKSKYTSGVLLLLSSLFVYFIAIASFIMVVFVILSAVFTGIQMEWQIEATFAGVMQYVNNIGTLLCLSVVAFSAGSFGLLLWKSAGEISREKDKNFLVTFFAGIISLVALAVSIVALVK